MSDLIRREDAIKAVKNVSETADRPQGEWIFKTVSNDDSEFSKGYLVCSVCGSQHANATPCNYCDNCGAKMKEGAMSKSEMIKGLQNLKKDIGQYYQDLWHYEEMLDGVIGAIETREGEWISVDSVSVCSICGAKETEFIYECEPWYGIGASHFCPNCGAKM